MLGRFIGLAALAGSLTCAEDSLTEAKRLNNEAARLYSAGQLEAAERLYHAALAVRPIDDITVAKITSNLAALYKRQDRYADAEALYQRVLDLRRKQWGPAHSEVALAMNNLAEVFRIRGRYWEARNLLQSGIRILEQSDPHGSDIAVLLNNLAVLDRNAGRNEDAEAGLRRALSLSQEHHGPDGRQVAIALNNLAQVLEDQQEYENADRLYSRAFAIFEGCGSVTDSAITLANLGRLYASQHRLDEAEQKERRALALLAYQPNAGALLRAAILQNLANIRAAQGDPDGSLDLFRQSLTIRESILGPSHPAIASVLGDYAEVALRAGKKSEAKRLRQRARSLVALRHQENPAQFAVDIGELRSLR